MSTDDHTAKRSLDSYHEERGLSSNSNSSTLPSDSGSSVSVLSMLNNRDPNNRGAMPPRVNSEYTAANYQPINPQSVSPSTMVESPPKQLVSTVKTEQAEPDYKPGDSDTSPGSQDSRKRSHDNYSEEPDVKPGRRFRRRYNQIVRKYNCVFPGCNKSYGSLNHLNTHIVTKKHGQRKSKADFHYGDEVSNNMMFHADYSNGSYWYLPHQQYQMNQQVIASQQMPMHMQMPYQRMPPGYVVYGYPGAPPMAAGAPLQPSSSTHTSPSKTFENLTQPAGQSTISSPALPGTMALMPGQMPGQIPPSAPQYPPHMALHSYSQPMLNPGPQIHLPSVHSSPNAHTPIRVVHSGMPPHLDPQQPYVMPSAPLHNQAFGAGKAPQSSSEKPPSDPATPMKPPPQP